MREIWLKIAHAGSARIYNMVALLGSTLLVAQSLGPDGAGTYYTVITCVNLFMAMTHFSLGSAAIRYAVDHRDERWLGPALGSMLSCVFVLTLVGWIIAGLLYSLWPGSLFEGISGEMFVLGFALLPFLIWERYGSSLLMAADRLDIYNNAQIVGRTVGLLLMGVVWLKGWGAMGMLAATLCAQVIIASRGVGYLWQSAAKEGAVRVDSQTIKTLIGSGLKLHWGSVGLQMTRSMDMLIVKSYWGSAHAGYYGLAKRLMRVLMILPESAAKVIHGKQAKMGPDGAWSYQRRVVIIITGFVVGAGTVGALIAPWIIPLVFGQKFAPAVDVFRILMLAAVGVSITAMMSVQWIGRGWLWQGALANLSIALFMIVGCRILVPEYASNGAAWAMAAAYFVSAAINTLVAVWCEKRHRAGLGFAGEATNE